MITRNIFISHSWKHSGHYERLVGMLNHRGYFDFKDYSVPKTDPLDATTKKTIRDGIRKQMAPCSAILVVAGVHTSRSEWIKVEIQMAKEGFDKTKPVIAVRPRGVERVSVYAATHADEVVGWNADSIVGAIRRHLG